MPISNSTDRFNGVVASLAIKVRCVLVATADVPVLIGAQVIEGISLVAGDRVLLTAQADPILNGIYDVQDPTVWTRAADWDGNRDVELGSTVWAGRAGVAADALYQVTAPAGVILPGSTAVTVTLLFDPDTIGGPASTLQAVTDSGNQTTNPIVLSGSALAWLDDVAAQLDLLTLGNFPAAAVGIGQVVANFNGADGDRVYIGDDGRAYTWIGSLAENEISSITAKFFSTSYLVGSALGAPDDAIYTNVQAENADFHPGTRDWYVRLWWNGNSQSQTGVNELVSIGALTGTNRVIRWNVINNVYSIGMNDDGNTNENAFPSFGAASQDGEWHEVVFERVGNGIYCYQDGVQSGATYNSTGNDIGVLALTGDRIVVVGGSYISGSPSLAPKPGTQIDALELRIGENIYGGVAPGVPSTVPPTGVPDIFIVGDADTQTRIHGQRTLFESADVDFVGNLHVGGLLTGDTRELPVFSPAGTGLIEIDWRTEFNPRINFTKGGGAAEIDATGQMHFYNSAVFRTYVGGVGTDSISLEHNGTRGRIATSTGGGYIEMSANNGAEDVRFAFGTGIKIQEKAAAHGDTAALGQIWVRNDVPNVLVFTDDTGVDTVLGGGGGSGIGAVGSIQWAYSTTAGGDPGSTFFRTSVANLTINSAFYLADIDLGSLDIQNILSTIPAGAYFVMRKVDDNSQFRVYAITSITDNAGWYQFNVDYIFGNGATTSLAASDEVTFEFFTSAYVGTGAEASSRSDLLYWDGSTGQWRASGTAMRVNPVSPPAGGRLSFTGTSGFNTASPLIMSAVGAVGACLTYVYGSAINSGFYQRYDPAPNPDVMVFGARVASVNTDLLTFNQNLEMRVESGAKFLIGEKAAAGTDVANYGQLWVRNDTPNILMFTDDAGTDFVLSGTSLPVGTVNDASLRWNGSAWVESTIVLIDDAAFQLQLQGVGLRMARFGALSETATWGFTGGGDYQCNAQAAVNDFVVQNFNQLVVSNPASNIPGTLALAEGVSADLEPQTAGFGQFWVRSSAPNRPTFADDTGVDQLLDPSISEIVSVVASRTLVLTDKGKTIAFTGSTAAQAMTIPANGSVAYQIGTFLGFDNDGSVSISIAITTDTLIFADDASTGTRTLAAGGAAVAQKISATRWKIAGAGLT